MKLLSKDLSPRKRPFMHTAAYERSNPVFNFEVSPTNEGCDTVHIVVGDAGNDETLSVSRRQEA